MVQLPKKNFCKSDRCQQEKQLDLASRTLCFAIEANIVLLIILNLFM